MLDCGLVIKDDSLKNSKLQAHQQLKHSGSVGKNAVTPGKLFAYLWVHELTVVG